MTDPSLRPSTTACRGVADAAYQRDWYAKNPDRVAANSARYRKANKAKLAEKNRAWNEANPDYRKNRSLMLLYGLSRDEYDQMLLSQNGLCAICGEEMKTVNVDHDHRDGRVRGLLCKNCNMGLGHFFDSIALLASAIKFLGRYDSSPSSNVSLPR